MDASMTSCKLCGLPNTGPGFGCCLIPKISWSENPNCSLGREKSSASSGGGEAAAARAGGGGLELRKGRLGAELCWVDHANLKPFCSRFMT